MKFKFIGIAVMLFSSIVFSQIQITTNDVASITDAGQGDLYLTTDTNQLYIGLTNGSIILIGNESIGGGENSWNLIGNFTTATQFLGTTNDEDLIFKVNNLESGRISLYQNSVALGYNSLAGFKSTLLGYQAGPSSATEAIGLGYNTQTSYQSVAIGSEASNLGTGSVAIGYNANTAYQGTAIGFNASTTANTSTAIGYNALATQANTIILGTNQNVGVNTINPNNFLEVKGTTASATSGLRLTGLGAVTPADPLNNVLSVNPNGDVVVTNNDSWLIAGNSNASETDFLGTTNDIKMNIGSNNTTIFEFGKRNTLGLVESFADYNDVNQYLVHIKGNGTSALQFEASNANFYKPMFFTTTEGNFRLKGSSAGTDYFEMGSAGTSNNGAFEFIVGDDGDEPITFKKYNYTTQAQIEMMRMQGTGLNDNVRVGIKTNGVIANSTLQIGGSLSLPIIKLINGSITLDDTHYTIILTNGTGSYSNPAIILPTASTCIGRVYVIKNISGGTRRTNFNYINRSGNNTDILSSNRTYTLQSDGTDWQLISDDY